MVVTAVVGLWPNAGEARVTVIMTPIVQSTSTADITTARKTQDTSKTMMTAANSCVSFFL